MQISFRRFSLQPIDLKGIDFSAKLVRLLLQRYAPVYRRQKLLDEEEASNA
ncbi:hypothetical protein CLJ1_2995 [Pseudomonas paraeruginosa]|nr:hypothetical protein CLJ1_2995 [Pseudomonas aeruginosa]